ncbi:MAG: acyltransferase family protein [Actinomycetota bacterium]
MQSTGKKERSESAPFVPGIDGLRALAVLVVLLFHLQIEWAAGGFLGVSLFFTLSGYLITQLLLKERAERGQIDLRAFWARRLRRLMPAAVLVITALAVAALAFDRFPSQRLRGDLISALGYAANWRFMTSSTSYAELFTSAPSPVLHFWSLAIEEQFYVAFPLVMAGLFALRRRGSVAVGIIVLWGASIATGLISTSRDVVYYGTHIRAAEILTGSLLALVLPLGGFGPNERSRRARLVSSPVSNTIVFGLALGGFIALVTTVDTGDAWLYSGGLAAVSGLSALLIVGVQCRGPVRWVAERSVAVRIGGLSYGLYLFHWPVFLILTQDSVGMNDWSLHALRLAVTFVLAWLSARCVEQPVRRRRVLRTPSRSAVALVAAVGVSLIAVLFVPRTPAPALAGLDAPAGFVNFSGGDERPELRILVIGSEPSAIGVFEGALEKEYVLELVDATDGQCPLGSTATCPDAATRVEAQLRDHRPDIVVATFGSLDRATVRASVGSVPVDDPIFFDSTKAYVNAVAELIPTTPTVLFDIGDGGLEGSGTADAMTAFIEDVALRSTNISALVNPTSVDILSEVETIRSMTAGDDTRERVMVVGDSTSYGISVAIDSLEGDRINVLWAGGQNCPLVEVSAVKWWDGAEFDLERCPTIDAEWLSALQSFQPSVVIVAVSVPEQAEQKYPGDPNWYLPGSEEYGRRHDEFIARFMSEISSRDIDVMVLDSPPIHGGALGEAQFSDPERIAAWNAVIQRWLGSWPTIDVVPWSAALAAFEPTPGALRGDGVHLLQVDLDVLVGRALLPKLMEKLFGVDAGSAVETETEPIERP